jgi:hypothetical protein
VYNFENTHSDNNSIILPDDLVDISAGSPAQYPYVSDDDFITVSLSENDVTLSSIEYDNTSKSDVSITGINIPWTTTSAISDTFTLDSSWNQPASSKIKLDGPEADIEVNGQSLITMLKNIEQRLNILKPNDELESEWSELKALGDQYRALEKHIQEKQATWDRLKAMPPPEID